MKDGKWKTAFLTLLILNIIAALIVFAQTKQASDRSLLFAYVHKEVSDFRNGVSSQIDFSEISYFSWQKIYIFGPYSTCNRINETLGTLVFWFDCKIKNVESYENGSIIIFKENGWMIRYILYDGIFPDSFHEGGYSLDEAHFILDERGRMIWVGNQ
ncbi:MAG: hypothetical protein ACOYZ8_13150 [Chloroflexota bacterium]